MVERRLAMPEAAGKQEELPSGLLFLLELVLELAQPPGRLRRVRPDPAFVDRLDRHRVEVIEALAAFTDRHDQPGPFEHVQVLHHRAAVELGKLAAQCAGGQGLIAQNVEYGAPMMRGKRTEYPVLLLGDRCAVR